jgi:hypothetical protein
MPASAVACAELEAGTLRMATEAASVIVLAEVGAGSTEQEVILRPEVYFKGAAEGREFLLVRSDGGECPEAQLVPGTSVLAFLESPQSGLAWPDRSRVFLLESGIATNGASPPWSLAEEELSERIRALTGQSSVPADPGDDGSTIDWTGTVLPLSVALGLVFVIGLAMMRVWHRIDPS